MTYKLLDPETEGGIIVRYNFEELNLIWDAGIPPEGTKFEIDAGDHHTIIADFTISTELVADKVIEVKIPATQLYPLSQNGRLLVGGVANEYQEWGYSIPLNGLWHIINAY